MGGQTCVGLGYGGGTLACEVTMCQFDESGCGYGWEEQQTPELTYAYNDIYFVDTDNGWAVGDIGKIVHTTDGGENWSEQTSGTAGNLNSVYFVDADNGWAVGEADSHSNGGGLIMYTSNGGSSWDFRDSSACAFDRDLNSVDFIDANEGWAVGEDGRVCHTVNGGDDWTFVDIETTQTLSQVFFNDDGLHGWIATYGGILKVYYTIDGGDTWDYSILHTGESGYIPSIYFINNLQGWATTHIGTLYYTDDGGISWTHVDSPPPFSVESIFFIDENEGWMVGWEGKIYHTTSARSLPRLDNWEQQPQPLRDNIDFKSVFFIDNLHGYVTGRVLYGSDRDRLIMYTETGGEYIE